MMLLKCNEERQRRQKQQNRCNVRIARENQTKDPFLTNWIFRNNAINIIVLILFFENKIKIFLL